MITSNSLTGSGIYVYTGMHDTFIKCRNVTKSLSREISNKPTIDQTLVFTGVMLSPAELGWWTEALEDMFLASLDRSTCLKLTDIEQDL
jgi:hypothetical protein